MNRGACFVYIIRSGRFYKIGFTNNLIRRVETIQVSSPTPVEITIAGKFYDYRFIESFLHFLFRLKRQKGEWYALSIFELSVATLVLEQCADGFIPSPQIKDNFWHGLSLKELKMAYAEG